MKKYIIIAFSVIVFIILYARFIGTKGIKVNEFKVVNKNLNEAYHGLKIVHISDIHYGSIVDGKKLCKVADKINEIKPDIVVLTGDLLDKRLKYTDEEITSCLSKINARLGKYAISGNHDVPVEEYYEIIENAGFTNLDNKYELIYDNSDEPIVISGMSSNLVDGHNVEYTIANDSILKEKTKELTEYKSHNENIYSILLLHEPDFVDNLDLDNYDLILAGHTHGRQVNIPIISNMFLPIMGKKYYGSHYTVDNTELYISSGLGTSGWRLRLFQKPSFNLYRITKK